MAIRIKLLFLLLCVVIACNGQGNFLNPFRYPSVPTIVTSTHSGTGGGSSAVVTPSVTPTAGNVLLYIVGGNQTRTPSAPAGWTNIMAATSGGGTMDIWYKVATGSEPSSYTFTFGGALTGGWSYYELSNAVSFSYKEFIADDAANHTSKTFTTYNIQGGLVLAFCAFKSASTGPAINNSFSLVNTVSAFFLASQRSYASQATGEVTTYSTSNSIRYIIGILVIEGK